MAGRRRAAIVRWRRVAPGTAPQRPEPWFNERGGEVGRWEDGSGPGRWVGLDAEDRPVLVERRPPRDRPPVIEEVWLHAGDHSVVISDEGARRIDGRVGATSSSVAIESGRMEVERWTYNDGVPVRGDIGKVRQSSISSEAYDAVVDSDGRLVRLVRGVRSADRTPGDDLDMLRTALERAVDLVCDDVVFEALSDAPAPWSEPGSVEHAASALNAQIANAIIDAVAASAIVRPAVLEVTIDGTGTLLAWVGGAALRGGVAAAEVMYGLGPPHGARLDVVARLAPPTIAALRGLGSAIAEPLVDAGDQAGAMLDALGRNLSLALNQHTWSSADTPFLALVNIGAPGRFVDPYALAADAVGIDRVEAFRRAADTPSLAIDATTGREELERELDRIGLGLHARRLAFDVAQVGYRLVLSVDGRGSRLGGQAPLAEGEPWPMGPQDAPLTHLATIDLAETRTQDALPNRGRLMFFADLDDPALLDIVSNVPGAPARVLHDPAPDRAERDGQFGGQPVVLRAQLTLPDSVGAARELGLDVAEAISYNEAARWLRRGDSDYWVLGSVAGAQRQHPATGSVLLLHFDAPPGSGLDVLNGGSLQFRIARDALATGSWERAFAIAELA
ncbi:MAG: hypothetical protein JWQ20_1284 [Conexibacter sp.]|nr:hypothetical protein [Conexibacter sp.]